MQISLALIWLSLGNMPKVLTTLVRLVLTFYLCRGIYRGRSWAVRTTLVLFVISLVFMLLLFANDLMPVHPLTIGFAIYAVAFIYFLSFSSPVKLFISSQKQKHK